jgi:hypothetical protein
MIGWFDDTSSYSTSATPVTLRYDAWSPGSVQGTHTKWMQCTGFERLRPATALRDLRPWAALEHPFKTDTGTSRLSASTINVIELLLDAGADINDPYRHWSDKSRAESPLYLALISNVEVAKFLLTRGALCDTQCLDFIDGNLGIGPRMAELQEIAKGRV